MCPCTPGAGSQMFPSRTSARCRRQRGRSCRRRRAWSACSSSQSRACSARRVAASRRRARWWKG
eukprot:6213503-Pleurochrysis_carterae.AAC.2